MKPTREEVIRVALEVAGDYRTDDYWPLFVEELERLAQHFYKAGLAENRRFSSAYVGGYDAGVSAAEEQCFKRRGVLLFNPYNGKPRQPSDIATDPHGILMLDPEQPLYATKTTGRKS